MNKLVERNLKTSQKKLISLKDLQPGTSVTACGYQVPDLLKFPAAPNPTAETMNRIKEMMVVYPFLNPTLNVLLPVGPVPALPMCPEIASFPAQNVTSAISPRIKHEISLNNERSLSCRLPLKRTTSFKSTGSNDGSISPHFPSKKSLGLRHLEELGNLRRIRLNSLSDDVRLISECNLCGTCSFACTTKFLGTFMRQHLYTHMDEALFTCKECPTFQSSSKDKATKHAWKTHNDDQSVVVDHRLALDGLLTEKAKMCFSTCIKKA